MGVRVLAILIGAALMASNSLGQAKVNLKKVGLPKGLVAKDVKPAEAALVCFLEGPAVDANGDVYFSDIAGSRILKSDANGLVSVFRADSGRTNGNTFDAKGRLISCEGFAFGPGGRRRMVRTDIKTGKMEVLTEKYEGKRYNSPNDVCVDTLERIWFTDPRYGDRGNVEMDVDGVYRIDTDCKVTRVLGKEVDRPNGIAVTPDDKTLYVVDSHPDPGRNRKIWAFSIAKNGKLKDQRLVFDFGKGRGGDGLRLDMKGNIWVAAGISVKRSKGETLDVPPGVYVISPKGKMLGCIPIHENLITNLAFGGPDRQTLYVTAGKTLYQFRVIVPGYALYPPLASRKR